MSKTSEPRIKDHTGEDFTKISFSPDLSKFKMETLDKDIVGLLSRRAFDVAASTRGVKVYLNGKRIPVSSRGQCLLADPTPSQFCTSWYKIV
jgi:DNA topoisomerase-2